MFAVLPSAFEQRVDEVPLAVLQPLFSFRDAFFMQLSHLLHVQLLSGERGIEVVPLEMVRPILRVQIGRILTVMRMMRIILLVFIKHE